MANKKNKFMSVDLWRMMDFLSRANRKTTIKEIHDETGIHRKILSALINHPFTNAKTDTINGLAQFFFTKCEGIPEVPSAPMERMEWVIRNLIRAYPTARPYRDAIAKVYPGMGPDDLWKEYAIWRRGPGKK